MTAVASDPLRVVLVGLSGVGKSAAGNTILDREEFRSETSPSSLTLKSQEAQGEVCGRRVTVVDTPGLFNTELSGEDLRREIQRAVPLSGPGPHAVLLVIQLGRFSQQEQRAVETLQELLGEGVSRHTVVLFTHGDRLKGKSLQQFVQQDGNLQSIIQKCGNRCHLFNNTDRGDSSQVRGLLEKVEKLVEENGGAYNPMTSARAVGRWMLIHLVSVLAGMAVGAAAVPREQAGAARAALGALIGGLTAICLSSLSSFLLDLGTRRSAGSEEDRRKDR